MWLVVICLKNRTFAVSQTTEVRRALAEFPLWFAWKIVLLQYRKQLSLCLCLVLLCCDLLEKSYFCSIANNRVPSQTMTILVVICLKNRTFAVSQTTVYRELKEYISCDLLEKSYFCSIANNWKQRECLKKVVVICLKNRTFAVSQTTYPKIQSQPSRLWFAWKIVLLQYRKQLVKKKHKVNLVVICLKNRTFAVSQTTCVL